MTIGTDASSLLLRNVTLPERDSRQDVLLKDGVIREIGDAAGAQRIPNAEVIDLDGYVLLPSFADPHTHLDKALLARSDVAPGDLSSAIATFKSHLYSRMTPDDVVARALASVRIAVSRGVTHVRTHVDCYLGDLSSLRAMMSVREQVREVLDLQVVALVTPPIDDSQGSDELVERVAAERPDAIGGCPSLEADPRAALTTLLRVAGAHRLPLDLHVDETLDTTRNVLGLLADLVVDTCFAPSVTASHCVSLGQRADAERAFVIDSMKMADLFVVTLPQTNLLLQGRELEYAVPRGLPPLRGLIDAGIVVAAGSDNWRDPFNPLSRIDPLETVKHLLEAGHLRVDQALDLVTTSARTVMGLEPSRVAVGHAADLVALRGASLLETLADMSDERVVIRRGVLVARTQVESRLHPDLAHDEA